MASIQRPLSGDVLVFDLDEERERTNDPAAAQRGGPSARTLLKDGPLRVTLIVLSAGGSIPEHQADGPITVQPLSGRIRFTVAGHDHDLGPGELLSTGARVRHAVASAHGASFLLTVALPAAQRES
ncbi:MAG: cupin domain-containing protein [Longimicrobiales bacterium]